MGIATDLYQMLSADLSARLDLERYNGIKEKRQETRQTIVVQPMQTEAKKEEKSVQLKAEPVQAVAQEVESKRPEAPVMDLYDLFGYTQEERRLAERGLKPERKKSGKSKGKKAVQPTLFSLPKSGKEEAAKKESGKVKAKSTEAASDITSLTPEEAQEMEEIIRNRMDVPQASR